MGDNKDNKSTRHWTGRGEILSEYPLGKKTELALDAIVPPEASPTIPPPVRPKARPLNDVRTLMDLDENIERRLKSFAYELRDDFRLREQRQGEHIMTLATKVDQLANRLETVESGTQSATRDSSSALESSRQTAQLLIEMRTMAKSQEAQRVQLESVPKKADLSEELSGLVADMRGSLKKWGFLAAITFGAISAASSFLGSHGTARQAADAAVQSAPKVQEKIFYVQPPPSQP